MQFVRVMSFNVYSPEFLEGEEPENINDIWANRADLNIRTIQRYRPAIIGFQEYSGQQHASYQGCFPEYEMRAELSGGGLNGNAIFYQRDRFNLLRSGDFWLTRTPARPAPDWDLPYALSVHWLLLRWKDSDDALLYLNTQFEDGWDPNQIQMREEGSKILLAKIEELSGDTPGVPVLLTGDFNTHVFDPVYHRFLRHGFIDTYRATGNPDNEAASTFHGFQGTAYR